MDLGTGEVLSRRATVLPALCGTYGCPCCAERNIRRNRKRALMGARPSRGLVAMLTATVDPKSELYREFLASHAEVVTLAGRVPKVPTLKGGEESRASVKYIGRSWSDWVTYARRLEPWWVCDCPRTVTVTGWACEGHEGRRHSRARCGAPVVRQQRRRRHVRGCEVRYRPLEGLAFFRGLELQRNGRAHIHAIVRLPDLETLFVLQAQLRAVAIARGFGGARLWRDKHGRLRSGFEIERARSRRAIAGYVSKVAGSYFAGGNLGAEVAKGSQQRTLPRYSRRASWSLGRRAWAPDWQRPPVPALDWSLSRCSPETVMRALRASGVLIEEAAALVAYSAPTGAGGLPA